MFADAHDVNDTMMANGIASLFMATPLEPLR
jgi:hypothetical protein